MELVGGGGSKGGGVGGGYLQSRLSNGGFTLREAVEEGDSHCSHPDGGVGT